MFSRLATLTLSRNAVRLREGDYSPPLRRRGRGSERSVGSATTATVATALQIRPAAWRRCGLRS